MRFIPSTVVFTLLLVGGLAGLAAQSPALHTISAVDPHSLPEWQLIQPHLPDPITAKADTLETAADVLRARRFLSDALAFYRSAADRGGNPGRLLKKEGVVHLELQHGQLAHLCFQQAVHLNRADAEAWNDLGASDFMLGNFQAAASEYKHAIKLNRESAIFRSNLALVFFELHNPHQARKQLARAIALDPDILHHNGTGGYNLQVLGAAHYAEICFEMARLYAEAGDREATLSWLTRAAERGFDIRVAAAKDPLLQPYLAADRLRAALLGSDGLAHGALLATPAALPADSSAR